MVNVMARRPSKHLRPPRPLSTGLATTATKSDGGWLVQRVSAGKAEKAYLCPGCGRDIAPGTPHVVAWPTMASIGSASAVDERRHWHTPCWDRRR